MAVIAERYFEKTLPDGRFVRAHAQLEHLEGNARPYFSLTGEEWQSDGQYRRRTRSEAGLLSCGAIHDTLVEAFPELASFARLHLADDTGAPRYAIENGWYWYANYDSRVAPAPVRQVVEHLRVAEEELPAGMTRDEFKAFVETLQPRWQKEADDALAFLRSDTATTTKED